MLKNQDLCDEYVEAIRNSKIHTEEYDEIENSNTIRNLNIIFSLVIATYLGYLGFNYFNDDTSAMVKTTKVMGVSYTIEDETFQETQQLENILSKVDVESLNEWKEQTRGLEDISMDIESMVNTTFVEESSYMRELSKELNGGKAMLKESEFLVVVKNGDTLASLAEEYYGDALKFDKIISYNPEIAQKSNTIYAGQELKIPLVY